MRAYHGDERTVGVMLHDVARRNRDKVFIYFKDQKITYGELDVSTNRIANALIDIGIGKGDRVAAMMPNCAEFVFTQFAVAKAGAIQVPINVQARGRLLTHFLNNSEPKVLIVDEQYLPYIKKIEDTIKILPKVIVYSPEKSKERVTYEKKFEVVSYQNLLSGSPEPPEVMVRRIDPVAIFYTSGTTGVAKGVVLPHNHQWHFPAKIAQFGRLTSDDIFYTYLPYFHGLAQFMATMPALLAEASVAIGERFTARGFWDEVRRYRATATQMVYSIPSILIKQPERPDDADNPLRVVYCSGIDPDILIPFQRRFNVVVVNNYGSTEMNVQCYSPYDEARHGAVGPLNEDFEIRIVDDQDEEVPRGKVGELISRAKAPYTQMLEYWRMPEETLEICRNMWIHSGDLGYIDEDNWFHFIGRLRESIRRRGEFISPYDIESEISCHPSVAECAALGVPSELGEDDVKVVVVLKEGEKWSPQELLAFCQDRLTPYMVPRYVEFVVGLPKTGTEKVEKVKLKEKALTPETWDGERGNYIKYL